MMINGLTVEQRELLDYMWNHIDSTQELNDWLECLDDRTQRDARLLIRLVAFEAIDEEVAKMPQYPEARRVILDCQ